MDHQSTICGDQEFREHLSFISSFSPYLVSFWIPNLFNEQSTSPLVLAKVKFSTTFVLSFCWKHNGSRLPAVRR